MSKTFTRQDLDRLSYRIGADYRALNRFSEQEDADFYNISEIRKSIFLDTVSVPEYEFSDNLLEFLCQSKIRVEHGWQDEEDLKDFLESCPDEPVALEMFINPQHLFENGKIRPDVVFRKGIGNYVIFEIDSFQYHSNQKQLTADKQRERKIQSLGHPVFRFSAKEILDDGWFAAIEAAKILEKKGFISIPHEQK